MQLDLSTLSQTELRQLLDTARSRGQASQSYRILQEMAARRDDAPKPRKRARRPAEPRVITLDLGDPLEPRDEFPETVAHDDLEVPPMPLADSGDDPIAGLTLGGRAAEPSPAPAPPRKPRPRIAVFAAGAALGLVAGWAGATATSGYAPLNAIALPQFDMAELSLPKLALPDIALPELALPDLGAFVGSSATAAEPAAETQLAELPPAPTGEAAPPAGLEIVAAPADAMAQAQDAAASAPLPQALPQPAPVLAVPPPPPPPQEEATNDCAAEATPADRTICAEPNLQKLQRDLRQAYARALDAHADRATLRQRQLAWRDARDPVDDPQELAALYEARIRKLNTATAEALRLQR